MKTIEGMGQTGDLHPLQEAFWANHGLQCGYCTPGMIMAAADLLQRNPDPSEHDVREALSGTCAAARATTTSSRPCARRPSSMRGAEGAPATREEEPAWAHQA